MTEEQYIQVLRARAAAVDKKYTFAKVDQELVVPIDSKIVDSKLYENLPVN
jgi:hypothetical protein